MTPDKEHAPALMQQAADEAVAIKLSLTPTEAALIWNLVDAQADAGACEDGNTPLETRTLHSVSRKLSRHISKFKGQFRALTEAAR